MTVTGTILTIFFVSLFAFIVSICATVYTLLIQDNIAKTQRTISEQETRLHILFERIQNLINNGLVQQYEAGYSKGYADGMEIFDRNGDE